MIATSASGYLSIDEVAKELEVPALAVRRLIARGRLTAVQLGTNGAWRIAGADLGRYISAGAPDLALPRNAREWFDPADTYSAAQLFEAQIIRAATDALPLNPPEEDTVVLSVTPAMRAVCDQPARRQMVRLRGRATVDFLNALHAYLVHRVRAQAHGNAKGKAPTMDRLYASPQAYEEITVNAIHAMVTGHIEFRHAHTTPAKSVLYRIPLAGLMDTRHRNQTLQAAF